MRVVLLSGGGGGAKLARGLAAPPDSSLTVIANTGDDTRMFGLHVSPDVDSVLYSLAGLIDPTTGWGLAGDTDQVMRRLEALGEPSWFFLGDSDLATHLLRTRDLAAGHTLTAATLRAARRLGVDARVLPMADDPVATTILTADGERGFQEWFVRDRCAPPAEGLRYQGIDRARITDEARAALLEADVIVVGPSNPFLSIGPILALPGALEAISESLATVVAVSPIVGGEALKGPTADMLRRFEGEATAGAVARLYSTFVDGFVLDRVDTESVPSVEALGVRALATDTVMRSSQAELALAQAILGFARDLAAGGGAANRERLR